MNICEVAILKLIQNECLSDDCGRVLSTLMKHRSLSLSEIGYFSGLRYEVVLENVVKLLSNDIVKKKSDKILIVEKLDSMNNLIDEKGEKIMTIS